MTQKEKIMKGFLLAQELKMYAMRVKEDSNMFDCQWGKKIAEDMERTANEYIKIFK